MSTNLMQDPGMAELITEFCNETTTLISQMQLKLEELEKDYKKLNNLEAFGQIIDRVMGAAKSFGLDEIATFCELGKAIGYKSHQSVNDPSLANIVVAVLFDLLYLLEKMVLQLRTGNQKALKQLNTKAFTTRLRWLLDKFKHIERASCELSKDAAPAPTKQLSQASIDDLMKNLGL